MPESVHVAKRVVATRAFVQNFSRLALAHRHRASGVRFVLRKLGESVAQAKRLAHGSGAIVVESVGAYREVAALVGHFGNEIFADFHLRPSLDADKGCQ